MTDYARVLEREYPEAEWMLDGEDYGGLTWLSDGDPPTQAELDALWPSVRDAAAWDAVRVKRDRLLAASDWTRMDDAPLTDQQRQAWVDYLQTLRDIPQEYLTPEDVVWPEAP